jgi:hypothetical protein
MQEWKGMEESVDGGRRFGVGRSCLVLPARAIDGVGRMALIAASATFHDGGADIAYGSAWILGHLLLSEMRTVGGRAHAVNGTRRQRTMMAVRRSSPTFHYWRRAEQMRALMEGSRRRVGQIGVGRRAHAIDGTRRKPSMTAVLISRTSRRGSSATFRYRRRALMARILANLPLLEMGVDGGTEEGVDGRFHRRWGGGWGRSAWGGGWGSSAGRPVHQLLWTPTVET